MFIISLIILCLASGCQNNSNQQEMIKQEVIDTEKAFASMAARSGIAEAFIYYADENAVLLRNGILIKGKTAIRTYFESQDLTNARLNWTPEFVEIASSSDLAYTYGTFTYTSPDENGNNVTKTGVFHTVWKKQSDDSWKFVWD
jgi:ketosteroid isomerase-like protein